MITPEIQILRARYEPAQLAHSGGFRAHLYLRLVRAFLGGSLLQIRLGRKLSQNYPLAMMWLQ